MFGKKNINTPEFWDKEFQKEWDVYSNNKEGFTRWNGFRFDVMSQLMKNGQRVLDLSCGIGHQARYMQARFPLSVIYATDFSPFAVEKTSEYGIKAFVSDCYSFTKYIKRLDVVLATEIIEHVSYPKKMLKEIKDSLNEGGMCIVTTPIKGRQELGSDHVKEFSIDELMDLMKLYFKDVEAWDYNEFQLVKGIK